MRLSDVAVCFQIATMFLAHSIELIRAFITMNVFASSNSNGSLAHALNVGPELFYYFRELAAR